MTPNGLSVMSLAAGDLVREVGGRLLGKPGNNPEAAGIGYGRRQFREADVVHAALDNGMLDAEHLGDASLHAVVQSECGPQYIGLNAASPWAGGAGGPDAYRVFLQEPDEYERRREPYQALHQKEGETEFRQPAQNL